MIFHVLIVVEVILVVILVGVPTVGITAAAVMAKRRIISNIAAAMRAGYEGNLAARFPQSAEQTCEHQSKLPFMPSPTIIPSLAAHQG